MKTYLGLPSKATGLSLTKAQIDALESFPSALRALETHAPAKLQGLDPVEIEWYHRLRNQLYHNGNGLTVERAKVLAYGENARLLFRNLFGADVTVSDDEASDPVWAGVRSFILLWREFELVIDRISGEPSSELGSIIQEIGIRPTIEMLVKRRLIATETASEIIRLNTVRRDIAHGTLSYAPQLERATVDLRSVVDQIRQIPPGNTDGTVGRSRRKSTTGQKVAFPNVTPGDRDAIRADLAAGLSPVQIYNRRGRQRNVFNAAIEEEARSDGELGAHAATPEAVARLRENLHLRWERVAAFVFGSADQVAEAKRLYDVAKSRGLARGAPPSRRNARTPDE